jgi:hypothetical protein
VAETILLRQPESMEVRRLSHLHRASAEQVRIKGKHCPLSAAQETHWRAAIRDGLGKMTEWPTSQRHALALLSSAMTDVAKREQQELSKKWRRQIAKGDERAVRAAGSVIKQPAPTPTFGAANMRADWAPWCAPETQPPARAENWRQMARRAGMQPQAQREWVAPTAAQFRRALQSTTGAAGLDGWDAMEVHALLHVAEFLIEELREVLSAASCLAQQQNAGADEACVDSFAETYYYYVITQLKRFTRYDTTISIN